MDNQKTTHWGVEPRNSDVSIKKTDRGENVYSFPNDKELSDQFRSKEQINEILNERAKKTALRNSGAYAKKSLKSGMNTASEEWQKKNIKKPYYKSMRRADELAKNDTYTVLPNETTAIVENPYDNFNQSPDQNEREYAFTLMGLNK